MRKFEIECKELTAERKKILAEKEVPPFSKASRAVMAVGGAWIFYHGTRGDVPQSVQNMAVLFTVIGIATILLAIFMQKLIEIKYFSKATKNGWFPASVSIGKGGVFVRRRNTKKESEKPGITSVNAEKFFAYAEVGDVEEESNYFKLNFLRTDAPGVFLFKKDFGEGNPEAFIAYINSKKDDHFRSK